MPVPLSRCIRIQRDRLCRMTLRDRTLKARRAAARPVKREGNRAAFLVGLGSLMDLRGLDTYHAMRKLSPPSELKSMSALSEETARSMSINTLLR